MNARTLSQFMLANVTLVIDRQGQIRELTAGAAPAPGEVVMTVSDGPDPQVQAQLIQPDNQPTQLNLDDEVAQILAQLEQGVDPTLNPDQATAAGGANGSSPTDTGTIDMTLAEVLAQTAFDTHGLQDPALSQTQSLAIDLVVAQALAPIAPVVSAAALDVDQSPYFIDDGLDDEDTHDTSVDDDEDGQVEAYNISYFENSIGIEGENPTVLGQVKAFDPDFPDGGGSLAFSLEADPDHPNDINYFTIDEETGEIYLTAEGAAAYTNDFEDLNGPDNEHHVYVVVSDGVNPSVRVPVTLNEMNVNEPPAFVDTSYTDETDVSDDPNNYLPGNDFTEATNDGESPAIATYKFYYDENKDEGVAIGQVQANDVDTGNLNYGIENNVSVTVGDNTFDLYQINSLTGEISLTALGAQYYSNYEDGDNDHQITVFVREIFGEEGSETYGDKVYATVDLFERNVNEAPKGEDFTVTLNSEEPVQINFDTGIGTFGDHISDEDVDFFTQQQLSNGEPYTAFDENQDLFRDNQLFIVITSAPSAGTLYYNGEPLDAFPTQYLDPNAITYKPEFSGEFSVDFSQVNIPSGGSQYSFLLDLGNEMSVTLKATEYSGGGPNKGYITLHDNPGSPDDHQGIGVGIDDGNGINNNEILTFDLNENPLQSVTFGLGGLNPGQGATVTYTLENGGTVSIVYTTDSENVAYDEDTGVYSVTYSSISNSITQIDFTTDGHSNYVVTNFSGVESVVSESDSFEYVVVDSLDNLADEDDLTSEPYTVTISAGSDSSIYAQVGGETLQGTEGEDIFTWLDSALDNSTDTVKNFTVGTDSIEIGSILTDQSTDADIGALLSSNVIQATTSDNDVVITVNHGVDEQQTIVIEDIYTVGTEFVAADLLADLAKVSE
ncbi:hypothetical protein [Vibrio sp. C8]